MNCFLSPLLTVVAKNIAFFAGSLLAVLIALTIYDEDVLAVEHVLSSITLLGVCITVCRYCFMPPVSLSTQSVLIWKLLKWNLSILSKLWSAKMFLASDFTYFVAKTMSAFTVSRSFIPDKNMVFCPEQLLRVILAHIHYMPDHWQGNAHRYETRDQFSQLFQYKAVSVKLNSK